MESQRHVTDKLDHACQTSFPECKTRLAIEKHASSVYTHKIPREFLARRWMKSASITPHTKIGRFIIRGGDEAAVTLNNLWSIFTTLHCLAQGNIDKLSNLSRLGREEKVKLLKDHPQAPSMGGKQSVMETYCGSTSNLDILVLPPKQAKNKGSGSNVRSRILSRERKPSKQAQNSKESVELVVRSGHITRGHVQNATPHHSQSNIFVVAPKSLACDSRLNNVISAACALMTRLMTYQIFRKALQSRKIGDLDHLGRASRIKDIISTTSEARQAILDLIFAMYPCRNTIRLYEDTASKHRTTWAGATGSTRMKIGRSKKLQRTYYNGEEDGNLRMLQDFVQQGRFLERVDSEKIPNTQIELKRRILHKLVIASRVLRSSGGTWMVYLACSATNSASRGTHASKGNIFSNNSSGSTCLLGDPTSSRSGAVCVRSRISIINQPRPNVSHTRKGECIGAYVTRMHREWYKIRDVVGAPGEFQATRRSSRVDSEWRLEAEKLYVDLLRYDEAKNKLKINYGAFFAILYGKWIDSC
ncbi:hypothetical protein DH2020_044793 [Rehmannia glutinosa]|uniref:Uncharacterized protein n=1 Tax=Rehmannia glutinosa TaxID=99300 RepID=A0ABR0UFY6_REHGL